MGNQSFSFKIYAGLVLILAISSATGIFLPQGNLLPSQELPASKPIIALANFFLIIILYGGLGFLGLKLSEKLGFAGIWDNKVSHKERFLIPSLIGVCLGIFFIITDTILSKFHHLGRLPHPPFPTSILASLNAGIGEELIFRLFYISFWVWLISHVILKKRWQTQIFWIFTLFSALLFAAGHIPAVMIMFGVENFSQIPLPLMVEIIILNGVLSIFAAYYFRKYGFLAAAGIHFWTDVVWHVIWGFILS